MSFTSATTGMQELHDVMSELSITDDVVKHVIEFIDRMQRLMKKLGGRCDEVTQFEPLASTLESIGCCCRKSIKWLNETVDHDAFEVQCKCRSILARHFDLLESILELYLKKKITPAEVMSHILSKTNQPDEMQKNIHWWETNFGNRTVIPFNEIFNIYCVHYFCDLETSQHNLWRQALYDTMTYIQSDKVTIHEYSYFLLCWYPYSHQSPKSLSLLLRQGCFQPLADRKNYNLLLKAPGDYFVRNTVNQGGGWCLSYLDAYMKVCIFFFFFGKTSNLTRKIDHRPKGKMLPHRDSNLTDFFLKKILILQISFCRSFPQKKLKDACYYLCCWRLLPHTGRADSDCISGEHC